MFRVEYFEAGCRLGSMNSFSLKSCYAKAWTSFGKWWIPLCLISAGILFLEVVPRLMVHEEVSAVIGQTFQMVRAAFDGDLDALVQISLDLNELTMELTRQLGKWVLISLPFVALLTVILLAFANMAVKDRRDKRPVGRTVWIAVVHVMLAVAKGFAFLFFMIPGFYLYVRLLFVSLVMLEDDRVGVVQAVRTSWVMTRGNYWLLFALVGMNAALQMVAASTIIGVIPVTGFANTARAEAFQMLRERSEEE